MKLKKQRKYKSRATLTPEQLREAYRKGGAKGGRSRSAAKRRASRLVLKRCALPGKAVAKLIRDVESKMLRNRETWLTAIADERITLDIKFDKLQRVRDSLRNGKGSR